MRDNYSLALVTVILLILTIGIIIPPAVAENLRLIDNVTPFQSPYGSVTVNATSIDDVVSLPLYQGTFSQNGSINIQLKQIGKERQNVTSASEAPAAAQKALEQYGGLPPDAVLDGASTTYSEIYDHALHATTYKEPMFTTISYSREVNGLWVFGDGNSIILTLGENGELLRIFKVWRDYTYTGDADIIPIYSAFEKLRQGEVLDEPMVSDEEITIDIASPAYYAKNIENNETILEPVWLLVGKTESGTRLGFYIYARHFANFTPSSTNITTFETIRFTDTSDTEPTRWHWDFGDGTSSTEQNPSHLYRTAGNFSVTLKAWNDMGSDTETREITVSFTKPLNADFNATPLVASTGETIRFYDNSDTSPNKWYWEFGDGTNSTNRNPTHAYAAGGNYTVNLTAWNANGSDKRTVENYIRIYPDPKPVARFASNFSWEEYMSPVTVSFTDTSSGNITGWSWDFGDGTNTTERNPVHVFTVAPDSMGSYYIVNLTVTDIYGRTSTDHQGFVAKKGFHPDFTGEPRQGFAPLNVTFTDLTEDSDYAGFVSWDFGDQNDVYLWGPPFQRTISHEYLLPGRYNVTLRYHEYAAEMASAAKMNAAEPDTNETEGHDSYSYYKTKEYYIIVYPQAPAVADFSANTTLGKAPLAVAFSDKSAGLPAVWSWDFGDGSGSAEKDPVHTYVSAGTYTISLTATNSAGSNSTVKTDYITVLPSNPPAADFSANITEGKSPLAVAFSDNSTNSPVNWSWDFGDGTTSAEQGPVHIYTVPGQYTVSLEVTNDDGSDTETREDYITVSMELPTMTIAPPDPVLPVADFNATPRSGNMPLAVVFNDTSSGIPTGWSWDFGDGGTSAEKDPVHTYTSAGSFPVTLTVTNPFGSNTTTKTEYIVVSSTLLPPAAAFTGTPTCGKAPLSVTFTDSSAGSPTAWSWDFGDGATSSDQNPVHIFTAAGKYTVSLAASNAGGSNTSTRSEYLTVGGSCKPPVAKFSGKPTSGYAPLLVTFTDSSTNNPTGWNWDFGDGSDSTEQNPVHEYTRPGKYTVSLTATNAGGSNTKTRTEYITVKAIPAPVANFKGAPSSGYLPLTVSFTDTSTKSPTGWSWDFGDGENSTEQNPVHEYTSPGKYTVSLTASNSGGSTTKTRTKYITVKSATPTPTPVPPRPVPVVNATTDGCTVRMDWDVITDSRLQGYKVVISKNNPNPVYPADGYLFWITDRYRNYSVITSTDHYNSGDFGGYLQPGQTYYFSITAVYSDAKVAGNAVELEFPSCGTPTPTCTTIPVTTCTQNPCEPHPAPLLNATEENGTIRLDWDAITNPCLQGYKVVISKNNPSPAYPADGYLFWITNRYHNYSVVSTADHNNGGDFGGYLRPGDEYYFSITAVYSDAKVAGNVLRLRYPVISQAAVEQSDIAMEEPSAQGESAVG